MTVRRRPLAELLVDSVRAATDGCERLGPLDPRLRDLPAAELLAAASMHRLTPAVAYHVSRLTDVPAEWEQPLRLARRVQLARHLRSRADLHLVQTALEREGIVSVAVKGPVAADRLWPRPDLREYYDLDIVVDRHRFGAALGVLEDLGCGYVDRNWPLLRQSMRAEIAMTAPLGTALDVHWHIAVPPTLRRDFPIDMAAMLRRRRCEPLGDGRQAWVLDPVDTAFHLAFHAAQAGANRLVWPADVWFAVGPLSSNQWQQLGERAVVARAELSLALVLGRAFTLFGTPPSADPALLAPAAGLWGRLVRRWDSHHPFPGLPGDPHLGGTSYSSARRHLPASLRQAVRSRWRLRRFEDSDRADESESAALGQDVPDDRARSGYLDRTERHPHP